MTYFEIGDNEPLPTAPANSYKPFEGEVLVGERYGHSPDQFEIPAVDQAVEGKGLSEFKECSQRTNMILHIGDVLWGRVIDEIRSR